MARKTNQGTETGTIHGEPAAQRPAGIAFGIALSLFALWSCFLVWLAVQAS